MKTKTEYRVRFVYDEDAQFEECTGESRPLTEEEYAEYSYRACPDHPRAGTKVIEMGGKGKPQIQGCAVCGNTKYQDIPYAEYLRYYGNPDRHVYLGCVVDRMCPTCGNWDKGVSSVWGIDMMDDQIAAINVGDVLTPEEALALPEYLKELADEELHEAGYERR